MRSKTLGKSSSCLWETTHCVHVQQYLKYLIIVHISRNHFHTQALQTSVAILLPDPVWVSTYSCLPTHAVVYQAYVVVYWAPAIVYPPPAAVYPTPVTINLEFYSNELVNNIGYDGKLLLIWHKTGSSGKEGTSIEEN